MRHPATRGGGSPFSFPVLREEKLALNDVSDGLPTRIDLLGISGLVVGGDVTLKINLKLMKRGVSIVGVPKIIGNDLQDVTFGVNTVPDKPRRASTGSWC